MEMLYRLRLEPEVEAKQRGPHYCRSPPAASRADQLYGDNVGPLGKIERSANTSSALHGQLTAFFWIAPCRKGEHLKQQ